MKKEINIGIVGTQFMAKAHSSAYLQASRFFDLETTPVLHSVAGRNPENLNRFAQQFSWRKKELEYQKLIEDKEIDLIDICTPNDLHMPIAIAAAKAGKHVLCEKPLARNMREAEAMYYTARDAGITHMVVSNYRFIPAIALAKKIISEGKLGEVRHFNAVYYQDWLVNPKSPLVWRHDIAASGSGAHGDMNAHTVDLARFLIGEFEAVSGIQKTFIKERPTQIGEKTGPVSTDDSAMFFSKFHNGALGSFLVSRLAPGRKNYLRLEIFGSRGSLNFNLERLNELEFYSCDDNPQEQGFRNLLVTENIHPYMQAWWPPGHGIGWEHGFIHQICALVTAIAEKKSVSPDFFDGLKCQQVLDAVITSVEKKTWVEINSISK